MRNGEGGMKKEKRKRQGTMGNMLVFPVFFPKFGDPRQFLTDTN